MNEEQSLEEKIRKVVGPREFNDRILTEGFPDGWYVQDRLDDDVALLIQPLPGTFFGSGCLCLRPKAASTDEWLPTARLIAAAIQSMRNLRDVPSQALVDVSNEKVRQVDEGEFGPGLFDEGLPAGTHALAGAVYALPDGEANAQHGSGVKVWRALWPFDEAPAWADRRERLVKAAALILREIEAIDAETSPPENKDGAEE